MGVYNGRAFPTLFSPQAPVSANPFPRNKTISLDFVGQKLQELLNSRQGIGSPDPLIKLKLDSSQSFGDQIPLSFMDTQFIENNPPPPDGQPLDPSFQMGVTWSHGISELGQFTSWFGLGIYLMDINSELLTLAVNSGDNETPLTMTLQFETGGPTEIQGSISIDIVKFEIVIRLTLRFHQPTGAVDLFGWVDDINGFTYIPQSAGPGTIYTVSGTFLGQQISGTTVDPSQFKTDLISKVVDVVFTTGSVLDPGGAIQKRIREGIFNHLSDADAITKVTLRDSINATASSWLMGEVIASGNGELLPYPNPCTLSGGERRQRRPEPELHLPGEDVRLSGLSRLAGRARARRAREYRPHRGPDAGEPLLRSHARLSEPAAEKGGMNRADVDGLKGDEFNMFDGRKIQSFRLAAGDTIFSPGPAEQLRAHGGAGQRRSYGRLRAGAGGRVRTRDGASRHGLPHRRQRSDLRLAGARLRHRPALVLPRIRGQRSRTASTNSPGRPNIDPWGAWEYANSSPLRPIMTDTIFERLTEREVSWAYFEHFYCFLRFFERHTFDSKNVVSFDDPERGFVALAKSGQSAVGVVRRSALRRLSSEQFLRRTPFGHPQQPAVHQELGRDAGRQSGVGEDAPHHHLRRARRLLRPCASGSGGQGLAGVASDDWRACAELRGFAVGQGRRGVRLRHLALRPHLHFEDDRPAVHEQQPSLSWVRDTRRPTIFPRSWTTRSDPSSSARSFLTRSCASPRK